MQISRRGRLRAKREHLHKRMSMCLYELVPGGVRAYEAAGELLKVLAAPARLAIVAELAEQPRFVHELVERLEMSQPLVSHHLRILRGAGRRRGAPRPGSRLLPGRPACRPHRRRRHPSQQGGTMTSTGHGTHDEHPHAHGPGCGHASAGHEGHVDYIHDGHAHAAHEGHYDEHGLPHAAHEGHGHVHGDSCGHEAVAHGDHVDYAHEGHRHAAHEGHYDEH